MKIVAYAARTMDGKLIARPRSNQDHGDTAASVESLATARCGCDERALGGGHRDGVHDAVNLEGASDTEGKRHVTDDVLTASTHDAGVVVVLHGDERSLEGLGTRGASCRWSTVSN